MHYEDNVIKVYYCLVPEMSPERLSAPMSPQEQALTPRMLEPVDINTVDVVQEAELSDHSHNGGMPQSSTPMHTPLALSNDDDLTSLSWLQDRNLLKGTFIN